MLNLNLYKNIKNYLGDSDEKNDKRYPPSMQKIRKLIREEDKKTKKWCKSRQKKCFKKAIYEIGKDKLQIIENGEVIFESVLHIID